MNESDDLRSTVVTLRGKRVVPDVILVEWFGITWKELARVVQKNKDLMPPFFVFHLDDEEKKLLRGMKQSPDQSEVPEPVYAFTIHGVILFSACLDHPDPWAVHPRIADLIRFLNKE